MSNILYVADLHFTHKNIIKYEDRPYDNVDDMDDDMISKWNNKVNDDDLVIILGDLGRSLSKLKEIIPRLKGRKALIIGNHDKRFIEDKEFRTYFEWIEHYKEMKDGDRIVIMSHYPMLSWDKSIYGSLQLYAHVHSLKGEKAKYFPSIFNTQFNVGWDVIQEPCTLDEVIERNKIWWKDRNLDVKEKFIKKS
jgi:calcineurin-like phosphoesterase family protein